MKDLSLQYIVQNLVQGVEGSSLEMIVERDGAEVSLRITRGKVVIPAVEYGDAEQMVKAPGSRKEKSATFLYGAFIWKQWTIL